MIKKAILSILSISAVSSIIFVTVVSERDSRQDKSISETMIEQGKRAMKENFVQKKDQKKYKKYSSYKPYYKKTVFKKKRKYKKLISNNIMHKIKPVKKDNIKEKKRKKVDNKVVLTIKPMKSKSFTVNNEKKKVDLGTSIRLVIKK